MAREFDGANQYLINVGTPPLAGYPITMAGWFYSRDIVNSKVIISIGDQSQLDQINLQCAGHIGGDPVYLWTRVVAGGTGVGSTTGFSANTWHHACGSVSAAGNIAAYIDGGSKGAVGGARAWGAAYDHTAIGATRFSAPCCYFDGFLAECAIWNVVLTDAEVAVLATGIRPIMVRPQSIVAYWPLVRDQDYDLVGGYDMTPTNGPTVVAHVPIIYGAMIQAPLAAPGTARVTGAGAYVELDPINAVRSTGAGAYVELLPAPPTKKKKGKPPRKPKKPKGPRPSTKYRSVFAALSAWWPAVNSAGSKTLFDIVGNNNAPMQGTVPWLNLASWGYSADMPGAAANYFNAGASAAICDTDMSIAAWVRFDTVPTAADERHNIIGRSVLGGDSYVLGLRCPAEGAPAYVYWQLGGTLVFTGTYQPVVAGETYHIVVAGENGKAPGTWSLYMDGELAVSSGYSGAIPFQNEDTYIGRIEEVGGEDPMNGQIIDIQMYGRPLTPAEVKYLFAPATRWDVYKPPEAWLPADIPIGLGGVGLSGLSALTGLSAIMGDGTGG